MMETSARSSLELEADVVRIRDLVGRGRATSRWQAAMVFRALLSKFVRLYRGDAPWQDLRLPIAAALLEAYADLADDELADLVETILPIEQRELRGTEPERG